MIFDKFWFERFQRILIALLNIPLLGQLLRRAMWIPELWLPIIYIAPDAVHVWTGRGKRTVAWGAAFADDISAWPTTVENGTTMRALGMWSGSAWICLEARAT